MIAHRRRIVFLPDIVGNAPNHADLIERSNALLGHIAVFDAAVAIYPQPCQPRAKRDTVPVNKLRLRIQITMLLKVRLSRSKEFLPSHIARRLPAHTDTVQAVYLYLREIARDITFVHSALGHYPQSERISFRRKIALGYIEVSVFIIVFLRLLEHDVPTCGERTLQFIE